MKALPFILLPAAGVAMIQSVFAEPPAKDLLSKYTSLWTDSPFTRASVVCGLPPAAFAGYTLNGVSPVDGGYFVVLQDKKDPAQRTVLKPGATTGIRVVEVRGSADLLATTVVLTDGRQSGVVGFDPQFLSLAKPVSRMNPKPVIR